MRKCSVCKNVKSIELFHSDASKPGGIGHRCKACEALRQRSRTARGDSTLHGVKAILARAKNGSCADCHRTYPSYVMDLDHRPGTDKLFNCSSTWGRSAVEMLDEIDKCDLVCSNCHRVRTWERQAAEKRPLIDGDEPVPVERNAVVLADVSPWDTDGGDLFS